MDWTSHEHGTTYKLNKAMGRAITLLWTVPFRHVLRTCTPSAGTTSIASVQGTRHTGLSRYRVLSHHGRNHPPSTMTFPETEKTKVAMPLTSTRARFHGNEDDETQNEKPPRLSSKPGRKHHVMILSLLSVALCPRRTNSTPCCPYVRHEKTMNRGHEDESTGNRQQQRAVDEHELDLFRHVPPKGQRGTDVDPARATCTAGTGLLEGIERNLPRGSVHTGALLPGVVVLKGFLTPLEQQKLVDDARSLGLHEGGFYKPTYASGARSRLHQMCLGRHWNVQSEQYEARRSNFDHARAPRLPESWKRDAQRSLKEAMKIDPLVMGTCPTMTPDICVVNFYKKAGRNGMHVDKDESIEALRMGSPVISFSIGCAAEFAYMDHYPKAQERVPIVRLESGDVLIFGGPARQLVHALTRVYTGTQPSWLRMRSGRLNLTFREYQPTW
ncbi:hypothetical protein PsorP6_018102 [Peronosclerospora sorghi]|uniref:Uncharacterized protein n=1 Tax=Peronosclerospora sorghi TaxID=230839 RepID=A0ACC0WC76_9STRA|nr:hypothetical protein PsorP6_018102 [Peronosclerospora sorghi]